RHELDLDRRGARRHGVRAALAGLPAPRVTSRRGSSSSTNSPLAVCPGMTSIRYAPPGRGSNDAVRPHQAVVFSGSTRNSQTVSGLASIAIVRSTVVSVLLAMLALLSFSLAFQ